MDGLKTGFTNAAGYSFIGTAVQKDNRSDFSYHERGK